jgi:hypothetical protein
MITVDKELKNTMAQMGTLLEKNRKNPTKRVKGYGRSGEKVTMYACRSGKRYNSFFATSTQSRESMRFINEVYETVLGVKPSISVIVRRALIALQAELIHLLTNNTGSNPADFNKYLDKLTKERDLLYECANMKNLDKPK